MLYMSKTIIFQWKNYYTGNNQESTFPERSKIRNFLLAGNHRWQLFDVHRNVGKIILDLSANLLLPPSVKLCSAGPGYSTSKSERKILKKNVEADKISY